MAGFDLGSIIAHVKADTSDFKKGMSDARNEGSTFSKGLGVIATGAKLVAGAAIVAGTAIAGIGAFGVQSAAGLESTHAAFTTMLKDGAKASDLMDELNTFAAATPFEFPELADAGKKLLAFGFASQDVVPQLTKLGDIASGLGIPIGELSELYGKARVQGRLYMEDINQLTGRGIPIIGELAKQFKVSEGEVRNLVETGKIGFPELEKAVDSMTTSGGMFEGGMLRQSKTFSGMISTFQDNLGAFARKLVGMNNDGSIVEGGIFDKVRGALAGLLDWLAANGDSIAQGVQNVIGGIFKGAQAIYTKIEPALRFLKDALQYLFTGEYNAGMFAMLSDDQAGAVVDTLDALYNGFMAIGDAMGVAYTWIVDNIVPGIQALIQAFTDGKVNQEGFLGAMQNYGNYLGTVFTTVLGILKMAFDVLWPSIKSLWDVIANQLWPALMGIYNVIMPVLIPVLQVLATIVGAVIVAAIWLLVNGIRILVSIFSGLVNAVSWGIGMIRVYFSTLWEIMTLPFRLAFAFITGGWDGLLAVIRGIPGRIVGSLGGVGEAIMSPFRKALDWIGEKMSWAKEQLDKLNPFHRNSPSLIDWITKGTDVIVDQFGTMYNAIGDMQTSGVDPAVTGDLATTAIGNAVQTAPGAGTGGGGGNTYIIKMDGIMAESPQAIRRIGGQIIDRINEEKRATGDKEIGK